VGVNRVAQIGNNDTTMVGHQHVVMMAPPGEAFSTSNASTVMTSQKIVLDTGAGARIEMEGDAITVDCKTVLIKGSSSIKLESPDIDIKGKVTEIEGTVIEIDGTTSVEVYSGGHVTVEGGTVDVKSGGTIGIKGAVVDVKGEPIKLNS
jgi:hypothetical protein